MVKSLLKTASGTLPNHERDVRQPAPAERCLQSSGLWVYPHNMQVLHSDNRKRVTLPDPARPKDSWIPEVIGPNQIVLTRVEKPARPRARLVRKNGLLLLSSKRPISWEETRKVMDEFP